MTHHHSLAGDAAAGHPASNDSKYVFAYGSLLSPDLMRQICPSAVFHARAFLPNYEVQFRVPSETGQGGISGIVAVPGVLTTGVIYEVAAAHIARLDLIEGVEDGLYRRDSFLVLGEDQQWYRAELYRPADPGDVQIDPAPFYLDHMIEGAQAHGLDAGFIAELQAWRDSLQ